MAFNVAEFRSNLVGDGARPNLFEVEMDLPFTSGTDAKTKLKFLCKTAQIPGATIGMTPLFYFGRELKFAGNRSFADWTITIINDENFAVRNGFETWMNSINSHAGNLRTAIAESQKGYSVDAMVKQYSKINSTTPIK